MILVFKTTVDTVSEADLLKPHLDELLAPSHWNFDLSDCDRILRVDAPEHFSAGVIQTLQKQGFDCMELE